MIGAATALAPLVGEPLSDIWRYFDLQKFEFGIQRPARNPRGEAITRADLGLVVACSWEIAGPEGVVVSSSDFLPDGTRNDQGAFGFYARIHEAPPIVQHVDVLENGVVCLRLDGDFVLTITPDRQGASEVGHRWERERRRLLGRNEQWRFLPGDDLPRTPSSPLSSRGTRNRRRPGGTRAEARNERSGGVPGGESAAPAGEETTGP